LFSTYDIKVFSECIKKIRNSLGYSRQYVSSFTGINSDTIRKIENGKCIPRFDTLEILSHLYKVNLLQLLDQNKTNTTITYFYQAIDNFIVKNDIDALKKMICEFYSFSTTSNSLSLINNSELIQLRLFFDALLHRYSAKIRPHEEAIELLINAIRITIPSFKLETWYIHNFNPLETRILYCVASLLIYANKYNLSNNILSFIKENINISTTNVQYEKIMLIKTYTIIAYNFHMLNEFNNSLDASDKGIQYCIDFNIMENLPLLLSRKGVALYNLNQNDFQQYLKQAVILLQIQCNYELANQYIEINKIYGINENQYLI